MCFVAFPWLLLWNYFIFKPMNASGSPGWSVHLVLVISIVALVLPFWKWANSRTRLRFTRLVLEQGHCPSCGYALADIPAADDGCTVCPECGSAWRISPPDTSSTPFPDPR